MKSPFKTATSTLITTIVSGVAAFLAFIVIPFGNPQLHGSHEYTHAPEDVLVLEGQEVYYQEGCQYCHSQGLRAESWELMRFSNMEKLGYFPAPAENASVFFTPSVQGSSRIGPDLSHIALKMDKDALRSLLNSGAAKNAYDIKSGNHDFRYLFAQDNLDALALSWKIRWMMNFALPLNDPYQRSVFSRLQDQTRGDALVEYLNFLGSCAGAYEGQFYQ